MISVDTQNRIAIPQAIREVAEIDFNKEIRLYIKREDNRILLLLSNETNLDFPCFGKARIGDHFKFTFTKEIRKYMDITADSNLLIYSLKGVLTIEKL